MPNLESLDKVSLTSGPAQPISKADEAGPESSGKILEEVTRHEDTQNNEDKMTSGADTNKAACDVEVRSQQSDNLPMDALESDPSPTDITTSDNIQTDNETEQQLPKSGYCQKISDGPVTTVESPSASDVSKRTSGEDCASDIEIIDEDDVSHSGKTAGRKDSILSTLQQLEDDLKSLKENHSDVFNLSDDEMSGSPSVVKSGKSNRLKSSDISKSDTSVVYEISDEDSDDVSTTRHKVSPKRKLCTKLSPHSTKKPKFDSVDSRNDCVVDIVDDDDDDVSFVASLGSVSTTQRCGACSQYLDNVRKVHPRSPDVEYVHESSVIEDSRVAVQGLDVDEEQQFRLYKFSIYDDQGHLVPLDSELIEKGKKVKFCGKVKGAFSGNEGESAEFEGLDVYDVGPIEGWWITGLYPGESVNIGISTSRAYYFLRDPSEVYASMMSVLNEKVKILKCVYEVVEDVKLNEDLHSFTYEDLLERLIAEKPELDATHLLLQHGGFVVQQILSFEEAAEDETGIDLQSTPLIKTLCAFSGFEPPKSRNRQFQPRRMPAQERRPTAMPMTKATTTPLVRQFFEHLFKDQLAKADKATAGFEKSKDGRCGVCVSCLRQDCGQCTACRSRIEFGGKGINAFQQICFKKQCEQQNVFYIDDEEDDEPSRSKRIKNPTKKNTKSEVKWIGDPVGFSANGKEKIYGSVEINKKRIQAGDFVLVKSDDPYTPAYVCKILYLFEGNLGPVGHVAHYCRGGHTVLGEVADPKELFAILDCEDVHLTEVLKKVKVTYWPGPSNWHDVGGTPESMWTPSSSKNDVEEGYWFRMQYDTETARFEDISPVLLNPIQPSDDNKGCQICKKIANESRKNVPKKVKNGFVLNEERYQVGDAVFLEPDTFMMENNLKKGFRTPKMKKVDEEKYPEYYRKWLQNGKESVKGNYSRISDPFQVAIILKVVTNEREEVLLTLRKMYRPENTVMSRLEVSRTDLNLLFWTNGVVNRVPASKVTGRCLVSPKSGISHPEPVIWAQGGSYRFYYEKEYNVRSLEFSDLGDEASNYRPPSDSLKSSKHPKVDKPLKTLDVFAGCGGLSAGLESSGVAQTKWAIEVYPAAAEAFALNHNHAKVINLDCNEVLKHAIDGREDVIRKRGIPRKGEVELMCGGPPCQGFSTMNAFTEREYSQFKNSCIVSYLSFCDFYRPKFFILENVRNFLVFKKAVMLKLCISALVRMGYQVTFGVLQAGNFGIPQTRLRAFIIAAAPGEQLPKFPEPETVFEKFSLRTLVDEKGFESSCRWTTSAPYRNVTTGDAISDLPEIESGECRPKMRYGKSPESHFQKIVRWNDRKQESLELVEDHVCRKVPPLTQARISLIPLRPGSDWRDLPNVRVRLEDGTVTDKLKYRYADKGVCRCMSGKGSRCDPADRQNNTVIPWAMVHTGKRNNQWLGCYGRVSNDSYFSTTITLPHPERKQGRVLHPTQNRIVSVRECARSQGFHDSFKFFGTILEKHRQIGNAVPPPVGRALGLEFRRALAAKNSETEHDLQDCDLEQSDCTEKEMSDDDNSVYVEPDPLTGEQDQSVVDVDDEDESNQSSRLGNTFSDQEEITLD